MVVWLLALPVVFLPTMGCLTVPVCAVVAYQLLGFEDIGVEIEQPFGTDYNDLPVDLMSGQLFNELVQCLGSIQDDIQLAEAGAELGAASQD
jgi:putative membrane protein